VVLLVDDALTSLRTMERALIQAGVVVETASDGHAALRLMRGTLYTLVVMDVNMPLLDGIECTRQLRKWEQTGVAGSGSGVASGGGIGSGAGGGGGATMDGYRQYILGASACPDEETRQEALAAGMDEFQTKPFVFGAVMDRVREIHRIFNGNDTM
jgi:CheY-like chemotaxis protein